MKVVFFVPDHSAVIGVKHLHATHVLHLANGAGVGVCSPNSFASAEAFIQKLGGSVLPPLGDPTPVGSVVAKAFCVGPYDPHATTQPAPAQILETDTSYTACMKLFTTFNWGHFDPRRA